MNLFVLDKDPAQAAKFLCDQHVVKMALETTQMLSTVARLKLGLDVGYKPTHENHPIVKWLTESTINLYWAYCHGLSICIEYSFRYNKIHASQHVLSAVGRAIDLSYGILSEFSWIEHWNDVRVDFICCMPNQYKVIGDPIMSYRHYYAVEKSKFARYKYPFMKPAWIDPLVAIHETMNGVNHVGSNQQV